MKLPKNFHPEWNGFAPIHAVVDWSYVRKLVRAARRGEEIRPILVTEGLLLTGTHRAAANILLELLGNHDKTIDVVFLESLEDESLRAALESAVSEGDYETIDAIWDRDLE